MKKKTIIKVLVLVLLLWGYLWFVGAGPYLSPRHIKFSQPEQAVIDAQRLMKTRGADPGKRSNWISPEDLPQSLRIPRLRYAIVFEDHLSLVVSRNPDWDIGARIWAQDATRQHEDTPTRYQHIYFYQYCDDIEDSPENIK